MSSGGVFRIITNDGKQDRMLNATGLLNRRLSLIEAARAQDPLVSDSTPTLLDIEKTHILFMNAHFKPFASIGYEYQNVTPQSSVSSLNSSTTSTVQFSIPQFGDFFGDMCFHAKLTAPTFTKATGSDTEKPSGNWCHYPGLRLLQKVSFTVGGNALDEYTPDSAAMYNQFLVPTHKRAAFNRCVGQENPYEGYLQQKDSSGLWTGTLPSHRVKLDVAAGPQTPKPSGSVDNLDMFIPLLFWFNRDPRLAIPSVAIPFGQRYITLTIASRDQMFYLNAHGNSDGNAQYSTEILVSKFELYINNIFVNPEVHDIYIQRIGFTLIRVHREQTTTISKTQDDVLMSNLKWPVETMYLGLRRKSYQSTTSDNDKWQDFFVHGSSNTFALHGVAGNDNADATAATAPLSAAVIPLRTVSTLSITAHGVVLYNEFPGAFADSYIPLTYGGPNITSPSPGAMMVNFNFYPETYQPSGHINVSRAREFYVKFTSAFDTDGSTYLVSSSANGELVVVAKCINFLLISDGGAVLRYST
jgi:hypothetical protein